MDVFLKYRDPAVDSGRRLKSRPSHRLNAAFEQLYLPWLCPAQFRRLGATTLSTKATALPTCASASRRRACLSRPPKHTASRSLATSADLYPPPPQDHIPFLSTFPNNPSPRQANSDVSPALQSWSVQPPIVIHEMIAGPAPLMRKSRGLGGDSVEIHQNLHACCAVGRYDRVESVLRRLPDLYLPWAPEVIGLHNVYLRSLVDTMAGGNKSENMNKMTHWFEIEIRGNHHTGLKPNAATLALMIRGSLMAYSGRGRDRGVRRILNIAEELDLLHSTTSSGEYTEEEWQELMAIAHGTSPQLAPATKAAHKTTEAAPRADPTKGPEILPMFQKGLGLVTLKRSLVTVDNDEQVPYPHHIEGTDADRHRSWMRMRQEQVEKDVVDAAIERWREENEKMQNMGINTSLSKPSLDAVLWEWQSEMERSLKAELVEIRKLLTSAKTSDARFAYGTYLEAVSADKLAAITIITVLSLYASDGVEKGISISRLTAQMGKKVENEAKSSRPKTNKHRSDKRDVEAQRSRAVHELSGQAEPTGGSRLGDSPEVLDERLTLSKADEWPTGIKIHIGALLLGKLIDVAKIPAYEDVAAPDGSTKRKATLEPAFRHELVAERGKNIGKFFCHAALLERLMSEPLSIAFGSALPMLVEPKPWRGLKEGAYLRDSSNLVRHKSRDPLQEMYLMTASDRGDLDQIYKGLDVLGKTAWRINKSVFRVMTEAWNTGEAIAKIPPIKVDVEYPPEPDASATPRERMQWRHACQLIENDKMGLHSNRCFINLQMEVARAFQDHTFYYPHNIDFRGRAYPLPPYLNHMGADHARGLLIFDKGKELGEHGLKWLKVQLANVYGFDKASLTEREQFATDHVDDIFDSATNPLGGQKWWLKAEDPWQCLAACMDLKAALESPDPSKYVSHLPVHQDGTCNGLQHYAALGGDAIGAAQVNLTPGDRPADIYSAVATLVRDSVTEDAKQGHKIAQELEGLIMRKVVKQTVMTNVYGVTFVGARDQVERQLDALTPEGRGNPNFYRAAYVTGKVFEALQHMFSGAHAIQYWLAECAMRISCAITPGQVERIRGQLEGRHAADYFPGKFNRDAALYAASRSFRSHKPAFTKASLVLEFRSSVMWTTPLRLPVVQPYRATRIREIKTELQQIALREPRSHDPISRRKQLQAFPPNFIHSLDATHMLLSALKCDEIGLTFAAVHDSFWTHASDIPVMNRVLRDAFVRMHQEDIMGRLGEEFDVKYKGCLRLMSVPAAGEAAKQIRKLRRRQPRRRGAVLFEELVIERDRQVLLASADPEEKQRGAEMVTPASIYEALEAQGLVEGKSEVVDLLTEAGAQPDLDLEEDVEDVEDVAEKEEDASDAENDAPKPRKKPRNHKLQFWVPLSFPPVPVRGEFDVAQLKESQYFFS
ncbi:DNA/RNA polymerase [Trichodelitschia bisporula]|uniref:DNA-directed RNA polymerase n=1 Tax=Trichodelitschia bisporula TaxID=703511 RepID=A0A6G1HI90_9PEZI|nr:DNA/RNA polymerase [Trichodelitschia bisporula]